MGDEPALMWKGHTTWRWRACLVLDTQGMETQAFLLGSESLACSGRLLLFPL